MLRNSKINLIIFFLGFFVCFCVETAIAQEKVDATTKIQTCGNKNSNDSTVSEVDVSKWKIYSDTKNNFSFRYPPNLILEKEQDKIRLYHFIKFKHRNPCDESDNAPVLKNLIDFDITLEFVKKDYKNFEMIGTEAPFDSPKLGGKTEAKSNWYNHEGCGMYEYIYPLEEGKSFVIRYEIIGFFNPVAYSNKEEVDKALKNPNLVIDNSDEMFAGIVGSFNYDKK